MDSAERSLLIKMLDTLVSSDKSEVKESPIDETPIYIKEPKDYIEKLKKRKLLLEEKNTFKPGDIILWKEGLKNKRYPLYEELCIVVKIFDEPLRDEDITSTDEVDIEIGFISNDDEFLSFNYDSSRFKLYKP